MTNELTIVATQAGLAEEKTKILLQSFGDDFEKARVIARGATDVIVTNESQVDLMQMCRTKRLELREVRINVEKTRISLKEQSLREGKAIDGISNVIKALIIPIEEHLQLQEDFIKIKESKHKAELAEERNRQLTEFGVITTDFDLGNMSDEAFNQLLSNSKSAHESRIALEKKAEQDRIDRETARVEEEKRLRAENERLQLESQERAKQAEIERAKREKVEIKLRTERAMQARKEAEERSRVMAEQRQKEKVIRSEALAPDKEKLIKLSELIELIQLPSVQSKEAKEALEVAGKMLTKASEYLFDSATNL